MHCTVVHTYDTGFDVFGQQLYCRIATSMKQGYNPRIWIRKDVPGLGRQSRKDQRVSA